MSSHDRRSRRGHPVTAGVLCLVACVGILGTTVTTWFHQVILRTDAWVGLMTHVLSDPDVISRTSRFAVVAAVDALDIEGHIATSLPADLLVLARPLERALEDTLTDRVADLMAGPEAQRLWADAHRIVHEQTLVLLRGGTAELAVEDGLVTINLFPLIDDVLRELQESGYIDPDIRLPDLRAPDAPEVLRRELQDALDMTLPADYGTVRLFRSVELGAVQEAVTLIDNLTIVCWLITLALISAALWLAPRRRHMVAALAAGTLALIALCRLMLGWWVGDLGARFDDPTVGPMVQAIVAAIADALVGQMAVVAGVAVVVGAVAVAAGPVLAHRPVAGPPRTMWMATRASAREHAAWLRGVGVGVVAFGFVWRVAGFDVALVAAASLVAWFAFVRWLAGPGNPSSPGEA